MLTALHIQDFVLIDRLSLPLGAGLTALTGETGAGKSILLEALGLAAGARTTRAAVRRGAENGAVAASFEPGADHPVWRLLEDNGIAAGDDQVILRRIQSADGRGRAFVNDQPVSIGLLRAVGDLLLEIHGQHDGVSFLSAAMHRVLLDEFAGQSKLAAAVECAWTTMSDADQALDDRRRLRENSAKESDYLRHVVAELSDLDPQPDEEATLAARRADMIAAQKVTEDLSAACAAMSEDGLEGRLSAAAHRLTRASAHFDSDANPLAHAIERVDRALSELIEARSAVEDAVDKLGHDERVIEETEERLFAIRAAARKHGVSPDQLAAFRDKAATALTMHDEGAAEVGALEKQAAEMRDSYFSAARKLSEARRKAAKKLDSAVRRELEPLRLGKAAFSTLIKTDEGKAGPNGLDSVEFTVATNPGADLGPLRTIASGGELSRFVLALKAALAAKENRTVIIFDEVDAGVGGAVADAVGERLSRLAIDAQVLVVTHSPQVAARANSHWRVEKTQSARETTVWVTDLDQDERIEEIARMLSGAVITDEARAAARRLLGFPVADKPVGRKRA